MAATNVSKANPKMPDVTATNSLRGRLLGCVPILLICLLARAATLEVTDLIDPTESRYAFVAQEMLLSGNWITPKLPTQDGLVPYLGKPPLHFWATALCYGLFGMDEWTSRLPSFLGLIGMLAACALFAESAWPGARRGEPAGLILLSSVLMFFFSGASVVDVTLSSCLAGAFASFARCMICPLHARVWWGRAVSVFLALGFLTKGPVALALFAVPVLLWLYLTDRRAKLRELPWASAAALFALVVAPWFILAELRNPGFARYFFWNENVARYLYPEYGDRYGSGHVHARGTSLGMLFLAFLPWSIPFLALPIMHGGVLMRRIAGARDGWLLYALLWGLWPGVFFTLGRQLHVGYVLPGLPGLALAMAYLLDAAEASSLRSISVGYARALGLIAACIGAAMIPAGIAMQAPFENVLPSLLLLIGLVACSFALSRRAHCLRDAYAGASLALVLLFSIFTFQGAEWAGLRRSTEDILREISRFSPRQNPSEVAVLSRNSYSHFWHAGAWEAELEGQLRVLSLRPESVGERLPENILASDSSAAQIDEHVLDGYKVVRKLGKWNWLRRSDIPLDGEALHG